MPRPLYQCVLGLIMSGMIGEVPQGTDAGICVGASVQVLTCLSLFAVVACRNIIGGAAELPHCHSAGMWWLGLMDLALHTPVVSFCFPFLASSRAPYMVACLHCSTAIYLCPELWHSCL